MIFETSDRALWSLVIALSTIAGCGEFKPTTPKQADQIVHVWDFNHSFWRDVRVGDCQWSLDSNGGIIGQCKTEPQFVVIVRDQHTEAILSRYCKDGAKVDGVWKH